jgi:hypothetical protein
MTYNQKLRKVMAGLDSDGADSEAEWAANILKSIGITPETPDGIADIQPKDIAQPPIVAKPHPNIPMPCCERAETRTPNCFVPVEGPTDFKSKGW